MIVDFDKNLIQLRNKCQIDIKIRGDCILFDCIYCIPIIKHI